jgi:hypothetical protein
MIAAVASHPEIIAIGRYALSGSIASAIAARQRIHPEVAEPDATADRSSRSSIGQPEATSAESAACVRLVAGDASLSSELVTLVHAARHFREQGKRVVWDAAADAAATCLCEAEAALEGESSRATPSAGEAAAPPRRALSDAGAPTYARPVGSCGSSGSGETHDGWTALFDRDSKMFASRESGGGDDEACLATDARAAAAASASAASASSAASSTAERDRLVVGSGNALCADVLRAWVLAPSARSAVRRATEELGGDLDRVVAFHVGDGSGGSEYEADVTKEVERLMAFLRENGGGPIAAEGWAKREAEARGGDAEASGMTKASAASASSAASSSGMTSSSSSSSKKKKKNRESRDVSEDETVRAYVTSAVRDLTSGRPKHEHTDSGTLARFPEDAPTLMDQFARWLRREDAKLDAASRGASRRLFSAAAEADTGKIAAMQLVRAEKAFESAEEIPLLVKEDMSLLERAGEKFESFTRELGRLRNAGPDAGERAGTRSASAEAESLVAADARDISAAHAVPARAYDSVPVAATARLSGWVGWRCVILGDDAKMARRVARALEDADAGCTVVDRASSREEGDVVLGLRSAKSRCSNALEDIVAVELAAGAKRAVVAAPAAGARLAALLQQCRHDRLDMVDWAGLGVHELSVSWSRDSYIGAAAS